jgi:hypothetical protein
LRGGFCGVNWFVCSDRAGSGRNACRARGEHRGENISGDGSAEEFDLGTWDYTETYDKTPFYPNGGSDTGVYTSEPGPGGNSIVNRFHSKSPMGDVDGMLVMTWDSQEKAYKSYVFGNDSPGCLIQTGNFEGDTLVYHSEIAAGGMHIKLRNVTRLVTSGGIVSEQWVAADSGPEKLLVRVEAKRRP